LSVGFDIFINENPMMRQLPVKADGSVIIEGKVYLHLSYGSHPTVNQTVKLRISIPQLYPRVPLVFEEIGGFIPKDGDHHVNPDGTLCLGSPFKVMKALSINSDINDFYNQFFIPYIYAVILKINDGIEFVFGELSHGDIGELEDLASVFNLDGTHKVLACLDALSMKKRIANKKLCPCGCGVRLRLCKMHITLNEHRGVLSRKWYRSLKNKLRVCLTI
jgi:hypothetical protein